MWFTNIFSYGLPFHSLDSILSSRKFFGFWWSSIYLIILLLFVLLVSNLRRLYLNWSHKNLLLIFLYEFACDFFFLRHKAVHEMFQLLMGYAFHHWYPISHRIKSSVLTKSSKIQHNLVLAHLSNLTQLQSTWPFCFSLTMSLGPLLWASVWLALYHYSGNYSSSEGRSLTTLSKTYLLLSLWLLLDVLIPPFISLIRVFHHLTLRHLPIYLFIIPFSWKTLLGQGHWFVHLSTLSAYHGASTL